MSYTSFLLPDGWTRKMLGEVVRTYSGGTPSRSREDYFGGDIAWIRSGELNQQTIYSTEQTITSSGLANSSARMVSPGTLLLAIYGATSGVPAITMIEAAINQAILAIIPTNEVERDFLYHWFTHNRAQIVNEYQQGAQPNLSAEIVKSLVIALPPVKQQQFINSAVANWDEAISLQTRKLRQLRRRKNGIAQGLLRGSKRLSSFAKKSWGTCPISAVAKQVSIRNQGGAKLRVLSCTKYNGLVDSLEYFGRQMFSNDLSTYKVVPRNTFAYATNHIEEGSIGYQRDYDSALISPMYTVFRTDSAKIDDDFMFHLLKSETYVEIYRRNMSGSINRRGGLRWDDFSRIKIPDIGKDEQRAIAEVLNTADAEIRLEEQQLIALREQKRGLLHQLLTGQLRLS